MYFAYLVSTGLAYFFNPDDTTNLFKVWIKEPGGVVMDVLFFWRGSVRPVGQLFYRILYSAFGWKPYPFRVCCLVILEVNLVLVFFLLKALSRSTAFRVIALLAATFHGALWAIYSNTGTIYDILCLTFVLAGMVYYASVRNAGRHLGLRGGIVISIMTVAAFESKEIGYMLPVALVALELLFFRRAGCRKSQLSLLAVAPATLCCAIGLLGLRYSGSDVFFSMGAYTPSFTRERFFESLTRYLHLISFKTIAFSSVGAISTLAGGLLLAALMRSRLAIFGWCIFFLTIFPLLTAPPRPDGYVLYVPYLGASIFVAAVVDFAIDKIASPITRSAVTILACCTLIYAQTAQRDAAQMMGFGPGGMEWIQQLTEFALPMCQDWKPGARIAVLNNPFVRDWQAEFTLKLACGNRELHVETIQYNGRGPVYPHLNGPAPSYATIALYEGEKYRTLQVGGPGASLVKKEMLEMKDPTVLGYIVQDVSESLGADSWRWTFDRPELRFLLSSGKKYKFEAEFSVAEETLKDTGPVTISFLINDRRLGATRYLKSGSYQFIEPVPQGWIKPDGDTTVAIIVRPLWTAPDGKHLGLILSKAGFLNN
jgi:hypothetical protein